MGRRITILDKGLLLIALPLICQTLFIALLIKRQYSLNEAQLAAVHAKAIRGQIDRVYLHAVEAQSALRGYLLIADERLREDAERTMREGAVQLEELRKLLVNSPELQEQLPRLNECIRARMDWQERLLSLYQETGGADALALMRSLEGQHLMQALHAEVEIFRRRQADLDVDRGERLRHSSVLQNYLLLSGLVLNVCIGGACAVYFSRDISQRLKVLTENTNRMGRGEQLVPRVHGTDEISELDANFHGMAAELARAGQKERVFQDVLARRNEELTVVNRELDHKSQENEMFVYSVSHDLRSPLVNLQGFSKELGLIRDDLKRLLAGPLSDEERARAQRMIDREITESIHYIQTAVTRLSGIIDALLRLSRAGRVEYFPERVDLRPVIQRIVGAMRATISERGAQISVGELPEAWGDPTALEQIFANLIGNAVNYLDPKRPGRIEVGCRDEATEGLKEHIYFVKDNGLGIPSAYLPKLFAVFQRLHPHLAPGEGIGLPLVRRMVERHGGKIWVESVENEGSTFLVSLPASAEHSPLVVAPRKESISLTPRKTS